MRICEKSLLHLDSEEKTTFRPCEVLHQPTLGGCDTQLQVSSRYSRPFKGFISKCSVPEAWKIQND